MWYEAGRTRWTEGGCGWGRTIHTASASWVTDSEQKPQVGKEQGAGARPL